MPSSNNSINSDDSELLNTIESKFLDIKNTVNEALLDAEKSNRKYTEDEFFLGFILSAFLLFVSELDPNSFKERIMLYFGSFFTNALIEELSPILYYSSISFLFLSLVFRYGAIFLSDKRAKKFRYMSITWFILNIGVFSIAFITSSIKGGTYVMPLLLLLYMIFVLMYVEKKALTLYKSINAVENTYPNASIILTSIIGMVIALINVNQWISITNEFFLYVLLMFFFILINSLLSRTYEHIYRIEDIILRSYFHSDKSLIEGFKLILSKMRMQLDKKNHDLPN